METKPQDFKTPGQFIEALLAEKGWTKRVFGIVLGVEETSAGRLVSDKRPIDADLALVLQEIFDVPAESFLDLQKSYDLAKARISAQPDPGRATRAELFGGLPIPEMIKRGWLNAPDTRNIPEVECALVSFFGVKSPDEIQALSYSAKKTTPESPLTLVQLAWVYRVKQIASEMMVSHYSPDAVQFALRNLQNLLSAPEEARKVPKILAECGIRFILVEALHSSKIDGVCFWLNDSSPVIGMSLRLDRIDNFWFVLRHELEHVLRGHGREEAMLDVELEGENTGIGPNILEEERVANEAASEFCVPQKQLDGFVARKAPFFAQRDIIGFAKTIKVHPGLIAGQLHHKIGRYDRFREHLVKIRPNVIPGSMVDGWGDVAPVGQ